MIIVSESVITVGSAGAIVCKNLRASSSASGCRIFARSNVGRSARPWDADDRDTADHALMNCHAVAVGHGVVDGHPDHHATVAGGRPRDLHGEHRGGQAADLQLGPEPHQCLRVVLLATGQAAHVADPAVVLGLHEPNSRGNGGRRAVHDKATCRRRAVVELTGEREEVAERGGEGGPQGLDEAPEGRDAGAFVEEEPLHGDHPDEQAVHEGELQKAVVREGLTMR
jgi:hypothetical protein